MRAVVQPQVRFSTDVHDAVDLEHGKIPGGILGDFAGSVPKAVMQTASHAYTSAHLNAVKCSTPVHENVRTCRKVGCSRIAGPKRFVPAPWLLKHEVFSQVSEEAGPFTLELFPPTGLEGVGHVRNCCSSAQSFLSRTVVDDDHLFFVGLNSRLESVLRHVNRVRKQKPGVHLTCVVPYAPDSKWFRLLPGGIRKLYQAGSQLFVGGDRVVMC